MKAVFQAIYDKVHAAIVAQGKGSMNGSSCVYRAHNGSKCAVGHLLSNEQMTKYNISESMMPPSFSPELLQELAPGARENDIVRFLNKLQSAHDEAAFSSEHDPSAFLSKFKEEMNTVADTFGLVPIKEST